MKINSNEIEQLQCDLDWKCVDEAFVNFFVTSNFSLRFPARIEKFEIKFNEVFEIRRIE